ncbi:hypothetical protein ZIOFF_032740 [Zingiber officinale]|uniref:Growth-regulating factor n=1 Tax=Zingiber officinale TaxID=94328 RepID=A0A8J5LBB2_ZINOF|nr:hypothetical protein ZIOFF_047094 [Zingiber officinale]KAG6507397.1 hypothetical protein ZIOFF_032740 [Zingiber officinale]
MDRKKWRCSREVVVGQKYCERHIHRGRNRSRKHVEAPTPSSISVLKTSLSTPSVLLAQENHLNLPRPFATPNTHSLDRSLAMSGFAASDAYKHVITISQRHAFAGFQNT